MGGRGRKQEDCVLLQLCPPKLSSFVRVIGMARKAESGHGSSVDNIGPECESQSLVR